MRSAVEKSLTLLLDVNPDAGKDKSDIEGRPRLLTLAVERSLMLLMVGDLDAPSRGYPHLRSRSGFQNVWVSNVWVSHVRTLL